ncbi:hypothetical protein ACWOFM_09565, partial [Aerococcus sanguinicola]
ETFVKDGEKGDPGEQGPQGPQGEKGEQGTPGTPGQDGQDGKSILAKTERGTKADETGKDRPGTWVIVHEDANNNGQVDPGEREISREFIFDGTDGNNGTDGTSVTAKTERGKENPADPNSPSGSWIRVYKVNPDGSQGDLISETFVKDGEKGDPGEQGPQGPQGEKGEQGTPGTPGQDGQDGKSSYVHVVNGPNEAGESGSWIITYFDKNGDGQFTSDEIVSTEFVADGKDGKDGKSVLATTERGTKADETGKERPGTWVIVHEDANNNGQVDPGEREISREFIFDGTDGKDGKTPIVESKRVEKDPNDPNSESGVKIIVRDPESKEIIKETFVKDGEKGEKGEQGAPGTPGQDGQDGKDGKSSYVHVVNGPNEAGESGSWIITYFDKNGDSQFTSDEIVSTEFVADGKDGQDGKDGKSVLATTERGTKADETGKDRPGTWVIVHEDANNNGQVDPGEREISREFIFDGTNGTDGKTPLVESERVEKDPNNPNSESGVKIIVRDPESKEIIKETFVKDGEKGEKGEQGAPGTPGQDGQDGRDGKSVLAKTERGTKADESGKDRPGTWVIVHEDTNNNGQVDPGEREISREFIFDGTNGTDGKDGETPIVESERIEKDPNDPNSESGVKIIVRDPETNDIIKETFVKDGEKGDPGERGEQGPQGPQGEKGEQGTPGQDGQDGRDGKSVLAKTERGTKADETGKDRP